MRKKVRKVGILPTRDCEAGYGPLWFLGKLESKVRVHCGFWQKAPSCDHLKQLKLSISLLMTLTFLKASLLVHILSIGHCVYERTFSLNSNLFLPIIVLLKKGKQQQQQADGFLLFLKTFFFFGDTDLWVTLIMWFYVKTRKIYCDWKSAFNWKSIP